MNLPKVQRYSTVPLQYLDEKGKVLFSVLWPLVVWHVLPGVKVSTAIMRASTMYSEATGKAAQIALVHEIPAGAEECIEVRGVTLIHQEWVEPGFVLVGRGDEKMVEVDWDLPTKGGRHG